MIETTVFLDNTGVSAGQLVRITNIKATGGFQLKIDGMNTMVVGFGEQTCDDELAVIRVLVDQIFTIPVQIIDGRPAVRVKGTGSDFEQGPSCANNKYSFDVVVQ